MGDDCLFPSPVSIHELMNKYDALLSKLHELPNWTTTIPEPPSPPNIPPQTMDNVLSLLNDLIWVCRLLMAVPSHAEIPLQNYNTGNDDDERSTNTTGVVPATALPWSAEQRAILETTTQRTCLLRNQLSRKSVRQQQQRQHPLWTMNDRDTMRSVEIQANLTVGDQHQCMLHWKIVDTTLTDHTAYGEKENECDNDSVGNDGVIMISTMDREALAAEEEILVRMASTPIP